MNTSKKVFFLLIFGFIISLYYSYYNLSKFDRSDIDTGQHLMIRGDIINIWREAASFKKDFIEEKKNFFLSGLEYTRTYLPSKIIAIYSKLFNTILFENYEKDIVSNGGKFLYLFFQSLIYYLSVAYFYIQFKKFTKNEKLSACVILFLCLEPTILQWHSSLWTESIYFTLQILLLSLIIKNNQNFKNILLIGIVVSLMYYQKTVTIFLIIPLIFYFLFLKIEKKYFKILILISTYSFFILFLGINNLKKTGIFYILPLQTIDAHYIHLLPQIFEKNNSEIHIDEFKYNKEKKWKLLNNYDENNFQDIFEFKKFQQSIAIEEIKNNKLITTKIYINKIFHHILLNPVQTYFWHEYNKNKYKVEYHLSNDKKNWLYFRIPYTLLVFLIMFLGFIRIIKSSPDLNFYIFLIICVIYYSLMLGWLGNTRYFMPSMIILSIFFGNGIYSILNFIKKK